MTIQTRKISVEEFWAMPDDPGHRYELVDGELVDMDGAPRHGRLTGHIYSLMDSHIAVARLPFDVGVSTGFQMDVFTLRFPGVHVTSWERMAAYDEEAGGWPKFAPEVAVEVVSPSNIHVALALKAREYFHNGALAMWIVNPETRTVTIRRPGAEDNIFASGEIVDGGPEIPGFSCAVAEVFAVLDRMPKATGRDN